MRVQIHKLEDELLVVHAEANAGIDDIDVPYLYLEDPEGMQQEAILARDLGFSGKGSIHPKQISILNEVFTPEPDRVEHAQKILKAFSIDSKILTWFGKKPLKNIQSIARKKRYMISKMLSSALSMRSMA